MSHRKPRNMDALQSAQWHTVHDYVAADGRRGAAALAAPMGMTPSVLSNSVDPRQPHKLDLHQNRQLMRLTGNYAILHALNTSLHRITIELPDFSPVSDVELLLQFAEWQAAMGLTCEQIKDTLADHRVELHEVQEIRRRGFNQMREFFRLLDRFEHIAEPAHAA